MIVFLVAIAVLTAVGSVWLRWQLRREQARQPRKQHRWQIFVPQARLAWMQHHYDSNQLDVEFRALPVPYTEHHPNEMLVIDTQAVKGLLSMSLNEPLTLRLDDVDARMRSVLLGESIAFAAINKPYSLLITGVS